MISIGISIPGLAAPRAGGGSIVTSNLVMHLDAGNAASYPGSGLAWTDLSGNGNNGTFSATPPFSSGVFNLNGSAWCNTTTGPQNPQTFTLGVWFRTTSTSGRSLIVLDSDQSILGSSWDRLIFIENTTGRLLWGVSPGSAATYVFANNVIDGNWRYATVSCNNGPTELGINGVIVNSFSSGNQNFSGWWRLCGGRTFPGSTTGGFIGDVAIYEVYNRALSAAEVSQNFNANRGRFGL